MLCVCACLFVRVYARVFDCCVYARVCVRRVYAVAVGNKRIHHFHHVIPGAPSGAHASVNNFHCHGFYTGELFPEAGGDMPVERAAGVKAWALPPPFAPVSVWSIDSTSYPLPCLEVRIDSGGDLSIGGVCGDVVPSGSGGSGDALVDGVGASSGGSVSAPATPPALASVFWAACDVVATIVQHLLDINVHHHVCWTTGGTRAFILPRRPQADLNDGRINVALAEALGIGLWYELLVLLGQLDMEGDPGCGRSVGVKLCASQLSLACCVLVQE